MLCEKCKKEIKVEEKAFEGLIVRPVEQMDVAFKDVKVPVGWRIPTLAEGILLVNNVEFVKWSKFDDGKHDFYVEQPFNKNKGKYAAWLGYYNDDFNIYTYNYLSNGDAVRGVLLVKNKED